MKKTNKIIITAREWFDKLNGNSYFAAKIELENETLFIPFSYGYGDHYINAVIELLKKENYLPQSITNDYELKGFCNQKNINLFNTLKKGCLKRELKELVNE